MCTHIGNPWQFRTPLRLGPGRARGSTAPPGKPSENLMCSSHIFARIHMKLGTQYRSYRAEQLLCHMSWAPPNKKSAIQGLFKKHNALEFEILLPGFSTHEHQTRWTWSQDIGDAKLRRDFWYLEWFARGEVMKLWRELRYRKCLIKSTYIVWFWSQFSVCSVYEADRIDVTIMRQSYSATNWQQEVCHFQNALNSASYFYPICFKLHQNNVKKRADVKLSREYWYLKYCCHGNVSNLNISSGDFEALKMFRIS